MRDCHDKRGILVGRSVYPVRGENMSMENTEEVATIIQVLSKKGYGCVGSVAPASYVLMAAFTGHLRGGVTQKNRSLISTYFYFII